MNFENLAQAVRDLINSIDQATDEAAGKMSLDERERVSRLRWGLRQALDRYELQERIDKGGDPWEPPQETKGK